MTTDINLTGTIDEQHLTPELRKAITQRDNAYEASIDYEADHYNVLSPDWLALAEAADLKAAAAAVEAGDDPMGLPSEIDRVRSLRPKVLAIHSKLTRETRAADAAVASLYRRLTPELLPDAHSRMDAAVKAAEQAYGAFLAAAGQAGQAMAEIRHLRDWATGGRSDAPNGPTAPGRADGFTPNASDRMAALREAAATYAAPFTPIKRVRVSTASGAELVLNEDQAKALVGSSNRNSKVRILGPAD